jgi:tRNA pseudouridine55 synthase
VRVFAVDKPLGPTSHDVVAQGRRLLGTRRVGHAGTLDPLATGVLVLLVDEATKLAPFLANADKHYLAWVALGVGTATLDAEGPITSQAEARHLDHAAIEAVLAPFLALREQRPPDYSAVQVGGRRAYAAARRGAAQDLAPRPARYHRIELLGLRAPDAAPDTTIVRGPDGWGPSGGASGAVGGVADGGPAAGGPAGGGPAAGGPAGGVDVEDAALAAARTSRAITLPPPLATTPIALIRLEVSAGTYVRAFARDLGVALDVPAHLAGLVRTAAGAVDLVDTTPLARLGEAMPIDHVALLPYPRVRLDAAQARAVRDGKRPAAAWSGRAALIDPDGRLVAIADAIEGRIRTARVWRS